MFIADIMHGNDPLVVELKCMTLVKVQDVSPSSGQERKSAAFAFVTSDDDRTVNTIRDIKTWFESPEKYPKLQGWFDEFISLAPWLLMASDITGSVSCDQLRERGIHVGDKCDLRVKFHANVLIDGGVTIGMTVHDIQKCAPL